MHDDSMSLSDRDPGMDRIRPNLADVSQICYIGLPQFGLCPSVCKLWCPPPQPWAINRLRGGCRSPPGLSRALRKRKERSVSTTR